MKIENGKVVVTDAATMNTVKELNKLISELDSINTKIKASLRKLEQVRVPAGAAPFVARDLNQLKLAAKKLGGIDTLAEKAAIHADGIEEELS